MASINFYVGVYYFFFYLKRPRSKEYLPFSLLCLSVGFYDVFCVGLYNSLSVNEGIIWQKFQMDTVIAISVFLIWFTGIYTGQKGNRKISFLIVWFIIILFVSHLVNPEYTLSPFNPSIKKILLFNSLYITYYEGANGIVYQIEIVSAIIAYIYLCILFICNYRKYRFKLSLFILICQIMYFFGVVNDSLVAMQLYSFVYISEYSFFFIVISMAYLLLDNFVNLHRAFEDLNVNLELKVQEKTREILEAREQVKRLEGIIPICVYCKKIRDDEKSWHQLEQYISEHSDATFSHGVCPECLEKLN